MTGSTFATGAGPKSLVLSSGYSYLYSGNQTDTSLGSGFSTITEFSQSSGTLTNLQTISAPLDTSAMGRDNSGKYVLAAGYNTTGGLEMYSIGTTGALSAVSNAPTGASISIPVVMALTH